ncbi:hypothetical protein O1611_g4821 [Lasiodiplodia mahajangana]|uniref:Uncharacterized protein n=1 Tax=Lasiodiplodia mahajangana TaxID=1108764 RepID=A0ACC2JMR5_9PEZI|nr:hypothetical protein O1611_g4821 [Lasiodiplodia mahajangana]
MTSQRDSLVDKAAVRDTIKLIKSLPTIRYTHVTDLTRNLTPNQYEQLLLKIQNNADFNKLRFEYTHSTKQFGVRVPGPLHRGIVAEFLRRFVIWQTELEKSNNSVISRTAETLDIHGNEDIKYPALGQEKAKDIKSPDGGIMHECTHKCKHPALVFEVEFSSKNKEAIKDKARAYITGSKGEIRTVIVVYTGEIHKAERKNERRLREMYSTGQVDESRLHSYSTDAENVTGEASILIWRATVMNDNTVAAIPKFRDATGNAIQSASLNIHLEDCVCKSVMDSAKKCKAPPIEISSEALCSAIERDLERYREKRAEIIREQVEQEKQKKMEEAEKENRREEEPLRRATQRRAHEGVGTSGRVMKRGRLLSTRIKGRRPQRERE